MFLVLAQATQKSATWNSGEPLVPVWLGVTLAVIAMIATAAHMHSLQDANVPESRRRIRTINGWVLIVLAPIAAYAFSMVKPADQKPFVFSFVIVTILLAIVILLACLDALNNLRLHREQQAILRDEVARLRGEAARLRAKDGANEA